MGRINSTIKFQDTGYFSKIMCDYLDQKKEVKKYFNNFPSIQGFEQQIEEKSKSFSVESRQVLHDSLAKQLKNISLSDLTQENLEALKSPDTFTVTTGHQLNLFTGPLYFLYKIISAINLAEELKLNFPGKNFVPVYWMATEDHDFEEICFFNFNGKRIQWNKEVTGAVGRTSTEGLDVVFKKFEEFLGKNKNANRLRELFTKAYIEHNSLTEATRFLANELFGQYGLLIVDGDDKDLKRLFIPYVKDELKHQTCFNMVDKTNESLEENYAIQVNPREINLFYLDTGLRERIIKEGNRFRINNTDLEFSEEEFFDLLNQSPEKFSPNVLMRPLYQEVILPNLAYIGGGGEMAYWLQLKSYFNKLQVPFPILLLRNSVLLIDKKQQNKLDALGISDKDIFLNRLDLIETKLKIISDINIDFTDQRKQLNDMFKALKSLSDQTDKSFSGAVLAQEKKQLNGLDKLEKRLLKAQKRKYKESLDRITALQDQLFPSQSLQERQENFSKFYEIYGASLIPFLIGTLKPLQLEFDILRP